MRTARLVTKRLDQVRMDDLRDEYMRDCILRGGKRLYFFAVAQQKWDGWMEKSLRISI